MPFKKGEMSGENNPMWKGGKRGHSKGYMLILNKKHPLCNKSGYVYEHRLVMEKHIGRYLRPEERVHHINGIKNDNRIKNLVLFKSDSAHNSIHREVHSFIIKTGKKHCSQCKRVLPISNFYKKPLSPFYEPHCKLCTSVRNRINYCTRRNRRLKL